MLWKYVNFYRSHLNGFHDGAALFVNIEFSGSKYIKFHRRVIVHKVVMHSLMDIYTEENIPSKSRIEVCM